jgi:integrase
MEVAALSTMLTWGVDHQLIGANPVAKIKPLPSDEKRKQRRSLTVEEVLALFGASPEHLRQAWRMFMTTGMREGELANLVFDDVDFDRRCATVHERTAKSHRCREIPLDDEMLETIRRLRDEAPFRQPMPGRSTPETVSKGHVFVSGANTPWRGVNLIKRFYRCCRLAGIEDGCRGGSVDIHSLRVSFITLSLQHGGNPKDVQEIVGHATSKMTMDVYAKATERGKRAAINALPFAKASDPAHVISLSAVQSMCKGGGAVEPQVKSAKGLG